MGLLPRCYAQRLTGASKGRFGYHPFSNPASRTTGAMEAAKLLEDMRGGNLESLRKALDLDWAASGASYKRSRELLVKHKSRLWQRDLYHSIRFQAS